MNSKIAGEYITPQQKRDAVEYTYYKNNIRTHAPKYTQYYDKPQKNIKRCKICVDRYDNGKTLTMMARQHKSTKEQSILYYLDIENGKVEKLKVYLHHNKKATLNDANTYYGTKTNAIKKLKSLMA